MAVLTTGRGRRTGRGSSSLARRQAVAAWVLAAPFVVLFLTFTLGPVLASLGMSFTDMRSVDARTPLAVEFVGLEQYTELFDNALFRQVAWNTALYVLLGVPLTIAMGLAAAVGLNSISRLRGFFRTGYYLPMVTSIVAVSVGWRFLLRDDGVLNTVLGYVGIDGWDWLNETSLALPSLVVMAAWRNFGALTVIFLAGLQTVPTAVKEAAEVDGAGRWRLFRHVTLPLLRPTMLFAAVITGIGYLQFFEEAYVMTQGGPLNSTRSVTYLTYDQFSFGNYGYASAMSYVLFLAVVALTAAQFRLLRQKDT